MTVESDLTLAQNLARAAGNAEEADRIAAIARRHYRNEAIIVVLLVVGFLAWKVFF